MDSDLERVQQLIEQFGNARRAALAFNREMERMGSEYRIDMTRTMQRVQKGEAKGAMIALVRIVLEGIKD